MYVYIGECHLRGVFFVKRIFAMVLVLMLVLGAAMAEPAARGWKVVVDGVVLEKDGEVVALNPSAELMLGEDGALTWLQLAVVNGGENALGVQIEYGDNAIAASVDGANDCLMIPDAELFLNQYELTGEEISGGVEMLLSMLENDETMKGLIDLLEQSEVAKANGENGFSMDMEIPETGMRVALNVRWEKVEGGKPFDLSGKNPCRYTYREMFPGDGTDIPEALSNAAMQLMEEESVAAAIGLLGEVEIEM